MREIKFRAWDDHYKYMNYKVLVGMWGKESLNDENYTTCSMYIMPDKVDYKCEPHWTNFEPYMEDIHLMQYTGLKDRNGKEIYEGDIIKIPDDYEMYGMACGEKYEVDFKNGRFRLRPKYRPDALGYDLEGVEECEVIGNKYENPELLEVIE